jgi:hypothetical protein
MTRVIFGEYRYAERWPESIVVQRLGRVDTRNMLPSAAGHSHWPHTARASAHEGKNAKTLAGTYGFSQTT